MSDSSLLLDVQHLKVDICRDGVTAHPLNDINFQVEKGGAVGLVGESGCGKTMSAYSLLGLLPPGGRVLGGDILYRTSKGDVLNLAKLDPDGKEMRRIRGGEISMIFQEPMTAFSPVHTIYNQIAESIRLHTDTPKRKIRDRAVELLDLVGIPDPGERVDCYPFQFSGGMRQRAMIAMALASNPSLLIADEPTTALDVTIQAQVLRLLKDLQKKLNLSLVLITHDLGVVAHMVEHVYVVYAGRVIESAPVEKLFYAPGHPYTRNLLRSVPRLDGPKVPLAHIEGSVPEPSRIPPGCPFHPRCKERVGPVCLQKLPPAFELSENHTACCFKHSPAGEKTPHE
ncbi:MAG: ABC transporter ATP-binding protein [Verrucomicrobia bacterium]|nr:ABC transporter ATP-binding protein [Verrucomicrobiota bacterium]MCH8526990.1 ABC transporter ATP-binding protein [Kiritimatiellia bacterium]